MIFFDIGTAREIMALCLGEARRAREEQSLLLFVRQPQPGWLREQLGRQLVALGQRLLESNAPEKPRTKEACRCILS